MCILAFVPPATVAVPDRMGSDILYPETRHGRKPYLFCSGVGVGRGKGSKGWGAKGVGKGGKGGRRRVTQRLFFGGEVSGECWGEMGGKWGGEWGEMEKGLGGLGSGCFGFDSFLAIRARHMVWFSLFLDRS